MSYFFYFYLSNFFLSYFYFYLSNFFASYFYFYLSTQSRYLLQHCLKPILGIRKPHGTPSPETTRNSAIADKPRDALVQMQWRG